MASWQMINYTSGMLSAVGLFSAVLVSADKAMLWQDMVAVEATPMVKTATTMAPGAC